MIFSKNKYKVSLRGRSGVIYQEGKKSALIEAEMMTGPTDLVIYLDSLRFWQSPYEDEIVTLDDKLRIKENVTKELEVKSLNIEWE